MRNIILSLFAVACTASSVLAAPYDLIASAQIDAGFDDVALSVVWGGLTSDRVSGWSNPNGRITPVAGCQFCKRG